MSTREPMWFCHECHAEMRPLMAPDPVCASCHSPFVEKLENANDDPRDFAHNIPAGLHADDLPPGMDNFLFGLHHVLGARQQGPTENRNSRPTSPSSPAPASTGSPGSPNPDRGPPPARNGVRFEFHSNAGAPFRTRTFIIGDPNAVRRPSEPNGGTVPAMSEFLRRGSEPGQPRNGERGDISGPMMAQYLMALLSQGPGVRGGSDPFAELFNLGSMEGGPGAGRWGDYVFDQEALDHIISQLMENSNAGRPVAASEEVINNLPRQIIEQGSPLLEKDCAVCKESFKADAEDPDEKIVVTLPCKHPFHESCILPWLKSSGTCPVCRYALVPQPESHPPPRPGPGANNTGSGAGQGPAPAGTSPPRNRPGSPPSGSATRSRSPPPRNNQSGASGIFHSIFGGSFGASSSGSNNSGHGGDNDHSSGARRDTDNLPTVSALRSQFRTSRRRPGSPLNENNSTRPNPGSRTTPHLPGGWEDQVD